MSIILGSCSPKVTGGDNPTYPPDGGCFAVYNANPDTSNCTPCGGCVAVKDGGTVDFGGAKNGSCVIYSASQYTGCGESNGITITNSGKVSVNIVVSGGTDDEVYVNGSVLENGRYNFWCDDGLTGTNPLCGANRCSGAHEFYYQRTLSKGNSFTLKGVNNGGNGGICCIITATKLG